MPLLEGVGRLKELDTGNFCKNMSLYQTFESATKQYATSKFFAKYEFISNLRKCNKKVCNYKMFCKNFSLYQTLESATKKYATTKIFAN